MWMNYANGNDEAIFFVHIYRDLMVIRDKDEVNREYGECNKRL